MQKKHFKNVIQVCLGPLQNAAIKRNFSALEKRDPVCRGPLQNMPENDCKNK